MIGDDLMVISFVNGITGETVSATTLVNETTSVGPLITVVDTTELDGGKKCRVTIEYEETP